MKELSSSIVALSGVLCFTAGGFIGHDDTQIFVMFVGGLIGLLGLAGWASSVFGIPHLPPPR